MFLKMLSSFVYYILIVSFNHCCGASHLIPTAISSPAVMRSLGNQFMGMGSLNTAAANAYSMYSLPYHMSANIPLQYSATYSQPIVDIPRIYNLRNVNSNTNINTNSLNTQNNAKKIEIPVTQRPSDLTSFSSLPIKYLSSRIIERQPKIVSTQVLPPINQKPINAQFLRIQTLSTTLTPNYHKSRSERVVRPLMTTTTTPPPTTTTTKRPKMTTQTASTINSEFARVPNLSFNWPKTMLQSNYTYIPKDIQRERQQTLPIVAREPEKPIQERFFINQHIFEYNTESPQMPTQFTPQESTTTATPKEEPMTTTPQETKEEVKDSDKKDRITSDDSEQSYQFFDGHRESNANYDPIPLSEPLSSYSNPNDESNGIPNVDNYPYFSPPLESEPEIHDNYDNTDKGSIHDSIDDNNESQLKSLLEQFIQQLDLLRSVAAKELLKSGGDPYGYGVPKNGQVISQSVVEPSVSKSGVSYDEYQNERSFEQNVANSETKAYKDSYDKSVSKKPCKKPYHVGALPYTGVPI